MWIFLISMVLKKTFQSCYSTSGGNQGGGGGVTEGEMLGALCVGGPSVWSHHPPINQDRKLDFLSARKWPYPPMFPTPVHPEHVVDGLTFISGSSGCSLVFCVGSLHVWPDALKTIYLTLLLPGNAGISHSSAMQTHRQCPHNFTLKLKQDVLFFTN